MTWDKVSGASYYNLYRRAPGEETKLKQSNLKDPALSDYGVTKDAYYLYQVEACNAYGCGKRSEFNRGYAALAPPHLRAINNEDVDGNFAVDWDPVALAGGYELQEQQNGGSWTDVYQGKDTFTRREGLPDGDYCYRARGRGTNQPGLWSNERCVNVGGVISTPTLQASDGEFTDFVRLTWNEIPAATHYRLYRNEDSGDEPQELSSNLKGGSHDNLSAVPGVFYFYRIRACKGEQCSKFSEINRGHARLPAPEMDEINNDDEDGFFTVDWERVTNAVRYQLEERQDGGGWTKIYDDTGSAFLREDRSNGEWCYRVRADNETGSSDWSDTVCTTVDGGPELEILHVEVTQAVQGSVGGSGSVNGVQLLSNKDTIVRVYLRCISDCKPSKEVSGSLAVDGNHPAVKPFTVKPINSVKSDELQDLLRWRDARGDADHSLNFFLDGPQLAGIVSMAFEIGGATETRYFTFGEGPLLVVHVVPINPLGAQSPHSSPVDWREIDRAESVLRQVFPVSNLVIRKHPILEWDSCITGANCADWEKNLKLLYKELRTYAADDEVVYGWAPDGVGFRGIGSYGNEIVWAGDADGIPGKAAVGKLGSRYQPYITMAA